MKAGVVDGPIVLSLDFGELPGRAVFGFDREEGEGTRKPVCVVSDAKFSSRRRVALEAHVSGSGDDNVNVSDISIVAIPVEGFAVKSLEKKPKA